MRILLAALALAGLACRTPPTPFERMLAENPEALKGARPVGGELQLRCDESDAEVLVDGVLQGRCDDFGTASPMRLDPGPHEIVVRKTGFVPYRVQIIAGDARTSLTVVLAPMG